MADELKDPEEIGKWETDKGAVIMLTTAPEHLGKGLILYTRMKDDNDGRWFSVYLDLDVVPNMSGTLAGFALRRMLEGLGGEDAKD